MGAGTSSGLGSAIDQLFRSDYPTWAVGVSVAYPIGRSVADADYARTRLEKDQAVERVKGAQARVIQQVRDAAWKVEMNAKRIDTSRADAGSRRTAPGRGAPPIRGRDVDELSRHPGPARPR